MDRQSERLRLLYITTIPLSLLFLRGQPRYMRDHGFEVGAVSSPGEELDAFATEEGIAAHPMPLPRKISPLADIVALWRLVRLFRAQRPDIVHAYTPKAGLLSMTAATLTRTPTRIYQIQGLPFMTAAGLQRTLLIWSDRLSARLAHRVICVSQSMRDVARSHRICPDRKMIVIGKGSANGVDAETVFNPEQFPPECIAASKTGLGIPANALVIGFAGRIAQDKGINELWQAWERIRTIYDHTYLLIAGSLDSRDPIDRALRARLEADPRVKLTGQVRHIDELYAVMDVVVLPSYREGFPTVPLEAASMNLPVVATRIPGCVDAVEDGGTGTLVPPRDANALRKAIECYLADPQLRAKHGKAGRERVLNEFQQEAIWEAICQEYCRLLTQKGIPIPEPVGAGAA